MIQHFYDEFVITIKENKFNGESFKLKIDDHVTAGDLIQYCGSNSIGCFAAFGTGILKWNSKIIDICGSENIELELVFLDNRNQTYLADNF